MPLVLAATLQCSYCHSRSEIWDTAAEPLGDTGNEHQLWGVNLGLLPQEAWAHSTGLCAARVSRWAGTRWSQTCSEAVGPNHQVGFGSSALSRRARWPGSWDRDTDLLEPRKGGAPCSSHQTLIPSPPGHIRRGPRNARMRRPALASRDSSVSVQYPSRTC